MMVFDRVYIEISNICNLQCSFCPEVMRPKKMISPEFFKKIIDEVKPFAKSITLHVMGEPLAHPQFAELLRLTQEAQIPVILTSNGLLLARHRQLLLNSPNLHQINFSIQSFIDNFPNKDVKTYLEPLIEFANDFAHSQLNSFINFRLWNLPSVNEFNDKTNQNLLSYFKLQFPNMEFPNHINVREKKSYRLDRHIKLHFDTRFEWPTLESNGQSTHGRCYGLTKQLAILTEGTVVPCCLDKEGVIALGNLNSESLKDILSSPRAVAIQQGFQKNHATEPLCQKCTFKTRFNSTELKN